MTSGGRHFTQVPGPTNVPPSVLAAIARPTIDHRGPEFAALTTRILHRLQPIFGCSGPIVTFSSSGSGAWEAALVNTMSPGDRVVAFETGYFSTLWRNMAQRMGLTVDYIAGDWRHGADPRALQDILQGDREHSIRAVCVVHNETSTGVASNVPDIRRAIDSSGHPALLLVDAISSLGAIPYNHDDFGVDVTVAGSQKGLMLPPGLGFNALSAKAIEASATANLARTYWDWQPIMEANRSGYFPSTPSTNLLFGLDAALDIIEAEGLDAVHARHRRLASATRAAVRSWGMDLVPLDEREFSASLTAFFVPDGVSADRIRELILRRFNMSLGAGLGRYAGRVIRIGHLGHIGDVELIGVIAGVQMGLRESGVAIASGLDAAVNDLERLEHELIG